MLRTVTLIATTGVVAAFTLLLLLLPVPGDTPDSATPVVSDNHFILRNVRVFDGESLLGVTSLRVEDGRIAAIGDDALVGDELTVIDGSGMTVLPGLIDAHTHSWSAAQREALRFGVTTMLDMFTAPAMLAETRAVRDDFNPGDAAALFSAGMLATVERGHGTQFGVPIETINDDTDMTDWVAARQAEGSDYIKLVFIPDNPRLPSLTLEQARAVIDAAHAAGLLALAHIDTLDAAQQMVDAGIDGLVHVFADVAVTDRFLDRAREAGIFVIPTLAIIAMVDGRKPGEAILADSDLAPRLLASQRSNLDTDFGRAVPGYSLDLALDNVRRLHAAGIPVLAGSDAPNPGTAHGATLHQELALLTQAGMSNSEALAAATAVPARLFSASTRGRIAVGARADLLLVDGDPTENILATRAIAQVFRNGYPVSLATDSTAGSADSTTLPALLGDFDDGLAAPAGLAWTSTSDEMMGGNSRVTATAIAGGVDDSAGAMRISATVGNAFPYPWAGAYLAVLPEGTTADISPFTHIEFDVRGTPASYRLMLFTADAYGAPPTLAFPVDEDWRAVSLPIADFGVIDGTRFSGLAITTPMQAGDYRFDIDNVRLRRD